MDFEKFSKRTTGEVEKELARLLKEWRSEVKKIDTKLLPLLDKFIDSCQGGKRIRGNLVVMGYEIGQDVILEGAQRPRESINEDAIASLQHDKNKEIYKIAAAYEILHSAILAHDDIIDQSVLRRGQASLYKAIGGGHYGVSQALSLGDAVFFLAIKILSGADFPDKNKIKALELFSKVMINTALGEMLDLEETDRMVVIELKTAYYTISGPLQIGAILAGGDDKLIKALGKFGESLGIAFQIQDDILDSEAGYLGGFDSAKIEAEKYKNRALKILPRMTKDKIWSKIFEHLAEYLVERSK